MEDLRSEAMDSREGQGLAARAWQTYARAVNEAAGPLVEPLAGAIGRKYVVDLAGFWLVWQLEGGFEGMRRLGMSDVTIYRKLKRFRQVYKKHPDEFSFPGVKVDPRAYWKATKKSRERRAARGGGG